MSVNIASAGLFETTRHLRPQRHATVEWAKVRPPGRRPGSRYTTNEQYRTDTTSATRIGARPGGLTLVRLKARPHGIEYRSLRPGIPGVLRSRCGEVEPAPAVLNGNPGRYRGRR
ncbi:MAG: hypothetical protein JOY55_19880 [Mycobacterium sp.]|nr:hypothetical protein [Mycobacterium sp.]